METITSDLRLRTSQTFRLPHAIRPNFWVEQKVPVCREKTKPIKWTGAYKSVQIYDRQVYNDHDWSIVHHSRSQVKQYYKDPSSKTVETFFSPFLTLYISWVWILQRPSHCNCTSEGFNILFQRLYGCKKKGDPRVTLKRCLTNSSQNDVPKDANILNGRFLLCIKNIGTGE